MGSGSFPTETQRANQHITILVVDDDAKPVPPDTSSPHPITRLLFMSGLVTEKNFQGVLSGTFIRNPPAR
jgi:hypothetical protein